MELNLILTVYSVNERLLNSNSSILVFFVLANIFMLSCEESLPSREETPVQLFETIFRSADGKANIALTRDPANIHTLHPPPILFQLQLINKTDETLQGLADSINGSLEIWIESEPTVGQTFILSRDSEFPPTGAPSHIESELLTIDPGDTFYVEIGWFHQTEDSTKLWDYFNLEDGESKTVKINALANIRLFSGSPVIVTAILKIGVTYMKLS